MRADRAFTARAISGWSVSFRAVSLVVGLSLTFLAFGVVGLSVVGTLATVAGTVLLRKRRNAGNI